MSVLFEAFASSSAGNAYRLSGGSASAPLLLECGITWPRLQKASGFTAVRSCGCLVSHDHMDHSKAVPDLLANGIPCYMSAETRAHVVSRTAHFSRLKTVEHNVPFQVGDWRCLGFQVNHDSETPGTMGYIIDAPDGTRTMFVTDCSWFAAKIPEDCNVLCIECNHDEEIVRSRVGAGKLDPVVAERSLRSHGSVQWLCDLLKASDLRKLREIHLLHLSDSNSNEDEFKDRVQRAAGVPVYVAKA